MTRATTIPTRQTVASELSRLIPRLRRAIQANARSGAGEPVLPLAQTEVIRLLRKSPGMRVQDVADRLGIAPNTASTLVGQLADAGLVVRERDSEDARVARLALTPAARARIAKLRDRSALAVAEAMDRLEPSDRELIVAAGAALTRLVEALETTTSER